MTDAMTSKLRIRELVENWVLWRDAGDWERFGTVWHDDGWMVAPGSRVRLGASSR